MPPIVFDFEGYLAVNACRYVFESCFQNLPVFCPEVTVCGSHDFKIQLRQSFTLLLHPALPVFHSVAASSSSVSLSLCCRILLCQSFTLLLHPALPVFHSVAASCSASLSLCCCIQLCQSFTLLRCFISMAEYCG